MRSVGRQQTCVAALELHVTGKVTRGHYSQAAGQWKNVQRQADAAQNRRLRVLHASQGVRGLRTCGVLVPTVKKMTTLETTARASCDQKLIQLMRLRLATPRQV